MSGRTVALLAMAALALSAQALTYTCVAPDGRKSFSDRPCPVGNSEAARKADGTRSAAEKGPHGLTFALMPLDASYKDVSPAITEAGAQAVGASCHAVPAPLDRPRQGSCDPYRGDTACSRSLPLLCYRPALRSARAPTTLNANTGQIATPAAGPDNMAQLGSGPSIRGDRLLSESAASALCEQALGPGWRMARFHDHGGSQIPALRHVSLPALTGSPGARSVSPARFWVAIGDQPGNCWDPSASQAATPPSSARAPAAAGQNEREMLDELRSFRSSGRYAKLSARCQGILDRVERSLRAPQSTQSLSESLGDPSFDLLLQCSDEMSQHSPEPNRAPAR